MGEGDTGMVLDSGLGQPATFQKETQPLTPIPLEAANS